MKIFLVGGTHDGESIEHDPMPYIIFPVGPPLHCTGKLGTEKAPLPPMPWNVRFDTERYFATKLSNGSRVWIEEEQSRKMTSLFYRGEAALNRARQYAKDADELNSRLLAQMASDEMKVARTLFAQSSDLCHPRRNHERLEN